MTTVSNFINNSKSMKEETKAQILNAIKQTGYRHNALAAALKKKKTGIESIGIVGVVDQNPFFSELFFEIERQCSAAGISVLSSFQDEAKIDDPGKLLRLMYGKVDALLIISIDRHDLLDAAQSEHTLPIVSLSFNHPCAQTPCGVSRFEQHSRHGGYLAGKYIAMNGHKQIACFTGPDEVRVVRERNEGFMQALEDNGINPDKVSFLRGGFTFASGQQLMQQLYSLPGQYTAVFCHNDLLAAGAINMAAKLKLRVPEDISILGYDDIKLASLTTPALTTIKIPLADIAGQLVAGIRNIPDSGQFEINVEVMPQLIVRDSVLTR